MKYIWRYKTPAAFDDIVMCGDGDALTGLWFKGSRDDLRGDAALKARDTPVFRETRRWLDEYFSGHEPDFTPNIRIEGATPFRMAVLDEMRKIPFGAMVSYGDIAKAVSRKHVGQAASARAVGGAVGWNPIGIIIPCHRVVGSDGSLTGYGGGLSNKVSLLAHEGADFFSASISSPRAFSSEVDEKLMDLLDDVEEDRRGGIFRACWDSPNLKVQTSLKRKFERWVEDDALRVDGRDDVQVLGAFLSKWTRERTFGYEELQTLTQWYLEHNMCSLA